ncbi:MAG: hypothetical protein U5N10_11935 [Gemmobacter sp.]|nr:hypothetical protein [Gemmobacter sp.]
MGYGQSINYVAFTTMRCASLTTARVLVGQRQRFPPIWRRRRYKAEGRHALPIFSNAQSALASARQQQFWCRASMLMRTANARLAGRSGRYQGGDRVRSADRIKLPVMDQVIKRRSWIILVILVLAIAGWFAWKRINAPPPADPFKTVAS